MCGIAGYTDRSGVGSDDRLIQRMTATLESRGPDAEGFLLDGPVALGHRRLRIIDLEGGGQPMSNEDGTVWVSFNGEIYNFRELRAELERAGHRFSTRSDTEAIVHAYEEFGDQCFTRLNGMFALAIWDAKNCRLVLARDRMGKKPLYYGCRDGEIVFGSELKALAEHPAISHETDLHALGRYLSFEFVPAPYAILKGTRKLPGGHLLIWESGRSEVRRYWDVTFGECPWPDEASAAEALRDCLAAAVQRRLVSDVPLGVLLSGGVDSSGIAALAARSVTRLRTFSIAFNEPSFDESQYARQVAAALGTEHTEARFSIEALLECIPRIFDYVDEPLADASLLPTYLLCQQTRQAVTVALGGDGGDELFLGYPTFAASRLADRYRRLPSSVRRGVTAMVDHLPVSEGNLSFDFKARQFLKGLEYPPPIQDQVWLGAFTREEALAVLTGEARDAMRLDDPYVELVRDTGNCSARDRIEALAYHYMRYYLAEGVLTKVDRASMANSLEVRAPLLDPEVVEFATHVPVEWKMGGGGKRLLKQALAPLLPREIVRRPKKGFGIPLTGWLRRELRPLCDELLDEERIRRQGLFDLAAVRRLLMEHREGQRDNRKPLWTLLAFQLWLSRCSTRSNAFASTH